MRKRFGVFAAAVLGLALASSLWWAYFLGDEKGALRAMTSATPDQRFKLAIEAYFYSYIPMLLGVIMIAAGVKRSIGHVMEPLEPGLALTLAAGVGLYLAGDVAFRRVMRIRPVVYRLGGALAALGDNMATGRDGLETAVSSLSEGLEVMLSTRGGPSSPPA